MSHITTSEAAERIGVSRQAFHKSILPLLIQRGEARQFGRQWAIDVEGFWMWWIYATVRKNLIVAGVWAARRPWSIDDMYECVHGTEYEDY